KIKGKSVEIILNTQFLGSMNRPMWVVKKLARERDQISLPGAEDLLGVTRFGNQSHRNSLDAGFVPHALRIGDMVARSARHNFRIDRSAYATRRTGDDIHPAVRQFAREDDRVVDRPLAPWSVGGRASKKQWPVVRPHCPHGLGNFERETHSALQVAAVTVIAPVCERAEKLVNQVSVSPVDFTDIESRVDTSQGCIAPDPNHFANVAHRQGDWCHRACTWSGNGARRYCRPWFQAARRVAVVQRLEVLPRQIARGLSAGVP